MTTRHAPPTRLVDRAAHAGARCVTLLGTGPTAVALVERIVEAQPGIDDQPLIVHLIHPDAVVEGRARLQRAADLALPGTRILHHRAEAIEVRDARNGAQLVLLASGEQMTTDGVVVVFEERPGEGEPGRRLLEHLLETGAARLGDDAAAGPVVPIDPSDGRILGPTGMPHSRRFAAGPLAVAASPGQPPAAVADSPGGTPVVEALVPVLLKLVRRLRPLPPNPIDLLPAPIAGFDSAALYQPGPRGRKPGAH